jgi:hypothetical protein
VEEFMRDELERKWKETVVVCFKVLSRVMCDYRRGLGWKMDLLAASNYSATADLHNSPQHPLSLFQPAVFIRSLATASNSGDSSASRAQILSSQPPVQNRLSTGFVPCL